MIFLKPTDFENCCVGGCKASELFVEGDRILLLCCGFLHSRSQESKTLSVCPKYTSQQSRLNQQKIKSHKTFACCASLLQFVEHIASIFIWCSTNRTFIIMHDAGAFLSDCSDAIYWGVNWWVAVFLRFGDCKQFVKTHCHHQTEHDCRRTLACPLIVDIAKLTCLRSVLVMSKTE